MSTSIEPTTGGFRRITLATAVAGIGGYVITTVIARGLGDQHYAEFALFWAALYLVIGALAGLQHEVSRASRPQPSEHGARPWVLACALAAIVMLVVGGTIPFWAPAALQGNLGLGIPVAVGAASYIFVAVFSGQLYGIALWRPLAVVIVSDVLVRLLAIVLGLLAGARLELLTWLTIFPIPIVAVLAVILTRRQILLARLDVGYAKAFANVGKTVLAATATAVLVSGFPLVIGFVAAEAEQQVLSALIFALVLTRAPLVVSALALQSYLVVHFRDRPDTPRRVVLYCLAVGAVAGALALAVLLWGQPVFALLTGWEEFRLAGDELALLVLSSVPIALLAITGAAVLARSQHSIYAFGWVAGAATAVALMAIPGSILEKTLVALAFGPMIGVIVHGAGLIFSRQKHVRELGRT